MILISEVLRKLKLNFLLLTRPFWDKTDVLTETLTTAETSKLNNFTRVAIGDMYFQQMRKNIGGRLPIIFSIIWASVSVPEMTGMQKQK